MLQKIENAVEDGDGFQFNEWIEYAKDIPSAEKTEEWCHECKEYDKEKHCCPRFNKVIRQTVKEMKEQTDGDLISRQAVLEVYDEWRYGKGITYTNGLQRLREQFEKLPSAEKEQKIGRWIEHFDEIGKWYECDQCHTDWGGSVNYCPNCGAKMQESEEKNEDSN
jgi:hypothetical protein